MAINDDELPNIINYLLKKVENLEQSVENIEDITSDIVSLQYDVEELKSDYEIIDDRLDGQTVRAELQERLLSGFIIEKIRTNFPFDPFDDELIHRYVSTHFYISINSEISNAYRKQIELAMNVLLNSFFLEVVVVPPPIRGSILQKLWARTKEAVSGSEAQERFEQGKRALEIALIDKTQSEANKNNAEAIKMLSEAIGMNGNIVVGNLVIEKRTNSQGEEETIAREMTQKQLSKYHDQLNSNSRLEILEALATAHEDQPKLKI